MAEDRAAGEWFEPLSAPLLYRRCSVEDVRSIDLHCTVKHLLFQYYVLFLGIYAQGSSENDRESWVG